MDGIETPAARREERGDQQILERIAVEVSDPCIRPSHAANNLNRRRPGAASIIGALDMKPSIFRHSFGDYELRRRSMILLGLEMSDLSEVAHSSEWTVLAERETGSDQRRGCGAGARKLHGSSIAESRLPGKTRASLYNQLVPDPLTRRDAGKTLLTALAAGSALPAATRQPLGFQLYTIRKILKEQARPALERLSKAGYRTIESIRADNARVLPLCKEFGLQPVSCHFDTPLVTGNYAAWKDEKLPGGYNWDQAVDQAAAAGFKYMVIAYLMPAERGSLDTFRAYADKFNKAGEAAKKAGMQFCYHHHAFEFGPKEGSRPIDIFVERFDPKLVKFESDVFWASVAGQDPAELLRQWKGRVALVHLKDKAPGLRVHYAENLSPNAFREVGLGILDFSKILAAARETGVERYFVEQDEMAEDPVDSLEYSLHTLEKLGF